MQLSSLSLALSRIGFAGFGAGSALALDFTSGNQTLDPRITFSRTTNATVTGSNGLIQYAPMNLLTFSEQFDNAAWTKSAITITANAAVAPNGAITADKVIPTAALLFHEIWNGFTSTAGVTYAGSYFVKAGEYRFVQLLGPSAVFTEYANFDLQNGTRTAGTSGFGSIESIGNGWHRISIASSAISASSTARWSLAIVQSGASVRAESFTGDGTSGIYIWGAQLELGSTATTYNPTTVKNLLGFTEHFDNAAWTKSNASISATKVDDIYGQPFAQKLVENTANSSHIVDAAVAVLSGTVYATSIYAKAGERTSFSFRANNDNSVATFNLATGTVGTATNATASITDVGNGWYRCALVWTATSSASVIALRVRMLDGSGNTSYTGDGTSGIYIFGAQLSDSASVDPYVYNPVAAPTSTAYYGPRFDYDPVTLAPKGLLIEEQRSNLLLNSATLSTQVVTVAATAHTLSFYGTGTIVLSGASTGTVVGTGAYPARTTLTFTPTVGVLTLTVTGSVTMAQLEAGAFATSYIPTVASQVTRAADSASMIGNNFARWYNQTEGTVFSSTQTLAAGGEKYNWEISDGTVNNRFASLGQAGNQDFYVITGGVVQANSTLAISRASAIKMAGAYKTNDITAVYNGTLGSPDTSATLPVVSALHIGSARNSLVPLNGTIARFAFYSRKLSPAEEQGITS